MDRILIARAFSLLSLAALAGGTAFAEKTETATYVVGNLGKISPGSAGTLTMYEESAIFRSGPTTIIIPYAKVIKTEAGPKVVHSSSVPVYKVWALHKRVMAYNTSMQNVTVDFVDDSGNTKTMTLEVAQASVAMVLDVFEGRRDPNFEPPVPGSVVKGYQHDWWGDNLWKTERNKETWNDKPAENPAGTGAPSK